MSTSKYTNHLRFYLPDHQLFTTHLAAVARLLSALQLYAVAGFTLAYANFLSGLHLWLARA